MDEHELLLVIAERAETLLQNQVIHPDPKSADAWQQLLISVRNFHHWQVYGNEASDVATATKMCDFCGCEIFFAVSNADDRWRPFELDPVDAADVTPSWRYVIDFSPIGARRPTALFKLSPSKTSGQVYVCHLHCCGARDKPKFPCAPYMRRWKVNRERADLLADSAEAELRALSRRLSPPGADES